MSRVCELTGKRAMVGNNVSHALNRTKRKFKVNLLKKRFYLPEEDRWVVLKISANALKTINKKGIDAVLKEAKANGYLKK
ncbi:MAG: 50S ribosomal protein L28 [Lutimonas sp.]|jgi:large subunit ribosomal protein L28|uniref:Large ribosomal subunit protein bL28 n=1 Tax=Namhaeicola litoreus TaxID=1052145 RepID=A0ABW3Y2M0_9FLAO